jgi:hypothetical protein
VPKIVNNFKDGGGGREKGNREKGIGNKGIGVRE